MFATHPLRSFLHRWPHVLLAAVFAFGFTPCVARAQVPDPKMWVTNGKVSVLATAGNTIYLGGTFNYVGPNTGHFVGIDAATGAAQPGWPRVNGTVSCAAADGAGGWYIAGSFTSVGGVARSRFAHIRADMSLDAFNPGVNGNVYALAVIGSTVYAGGTFTTIGGQNRSFLAALDGTTGLVTAWNPAPTNYVDALAVGGTTLYVGGQFPTIGGQTRSHIAALDATTGLATAWDPGANNNYVWALAVSGSTVYAGGDFSTIGGQSRSCIAALDATTGLATAWNPGANDWVLAFAVSGSTVYAGGRFTSIGTQTRNYFAALDATTGLATAWNPMATDRVLTVAVSGSTVYAGGWFSSMGGQTRYNLAAVDATTGLATAWNPGATNGMTLPSVSTLAVSGSTVVAGGDFTSTGGLVRRQIAALDATTGAVTAWDPAANIGGAVSALAVGGSTVYTAGSFSSIGGQNRQAIAGLDITTGLATAWDPTVAGGVAILQLSGPLVYAGGNFSSIGGAGRGSLAALDATTGLATAWNPGASAAVSTLAVSGSTVYLGGQFTYLNGQTRYYIGAVDATTGLTTPWNPTANMYGGYVYALAPSGSTVYAGGQFSSIGGQTRSCLAALDAATGLASAWNPAPESYVAALAVSGSTIYAGGYFTTIGGQNRSRIAALDATTGLATAWNPSANSIVRALSVNGSTVYAAGEFTTIGGQNHVGFAALKPDAAAPTVLVISPNGGETFLVGTQHLLTWLATDDLAVQNVDLHLSRTGPAGPWELIAAAALNTGSYLWTVTAPLVTGNNAYLRVQARDFSGNLGTDLSDGGFNISNSALDAGPGGTVAAFALSAPAPNPAVLRSQLGYAVPARSHVHLSLLDVQGREVAVLADGVREAGRYTAAFEAAGLHTGMYFVRMQAPGVELVRRAVVVK